MAAQSAPKAWPRAKRRHGKSGPPSYVKQKANVAAGLCRCGRVRIEGRKSCEICTLTKRSASRERNRRLRQLGMCPTCGGPRDGRWVRCVRCTTEHANLSRRIKAAAIAAYGGKCRCCGETEQAFLTIDHTNNDGNQHRKMTPCGGDKIYRWLKKNDYPKDGFALMCFNCNLGRRVNGGICPHMPMTVTPY